MINFFYKFTEDADLAGKKVVKGLINVFEVEFSRRKRI